MKSLMDRRGPSVPEPFEALVRLAGPQAVASAGVVSHSNDALRYVSTAAVFVLYNFKIASDGVQRCA